MASLSSPSTGTSVLATPAAPRIDAGGGAVGAIAPLSPLSAVRPASRQPAAPASLMWVAGADSPFLDAELQQDVAAGQQAQAWLGELGQQLQGLKQSLAGLLAGSGNPTSTAAALQQVGATWRQRGTQAGGMVDAQMQVREPGQARQVFAVRGLDLANLTQEGPETLSFAVPGTGAPVAVAIDPDQNAHTTVQRLDQALAPAGLRVAIVAGRLQWSSAESQWPALRDGLSVKGDGRRFPSGQRVRVRLDTPPDAIQPATWSLDGAQAQRQTLGRVIAAQALLRDAGDALDRRRSAARLAEPVGAAGQGQVLLGLAQDFEAKAAEPAYENYAQLAPALRGLRRDQVRALLSS